MLVYKIPFVCRFFFCWVMEQTVRVNKAQKAKFMVPHWEEGKKKQQTGKSVPHTSLKNATFLFIITVVTKRNYQQWGPLTYVCLANYSNSEKRASITCLTANICFIYTTYVIQFHVFIFFSFLLNTSSSEFISTCTVPHAPTFLINKK